ncbi:deoxyribose-phosphate aldolase [Mesonia sediminis]|uniref:Deoxyribose-phosphate aldolase n=1 Tax=Mesonia sediminis TaxID=1703946 RepID=A0ABW5SE77_9FLAO
MSMKQFIDHTLLKPTASLQQIEQLCKEAKANEFFAICVNGCWVKQAVSFLKDSDVKVAAVVGFPLGAMHTKAKVFEAKQAVADGAQEIDMVLNLGDLKSGNYPAVEEDIAAVKEAIGDKTLKVILETCYLEEEEIAKACELAVAAKADFVKTSTGFGSAGATLEHVKLMKSCVGEKAEVKASGGIRDRATAEKFIEAGATRIGTSSGIKIVTDI